MMFKEASKYVQMRLRRSGYCMICGERIEEHDAFEYTTVRLGKCKYYSFFHTACLTKRIRMAELANDYEINSLVDQQRGV